MTLKFIQLDSRFAIEEALLDARLKSLTTELTIVSHEIGADREQWVIRYQNELFIVFVEWLSESVWLEPMQSTGENHLATFHQLLS